MGQTGRQGQNLQGRQGHGQGHDVQGQHWGQGLLTGVRWQSRWWLNVKVLSWQLQVDTDDIGKDSEVITIETIHCVLHRPTHTNALIVHI